jgi:hypothetical protein
VERERRRMEIEEALEEDEMDCGEEGMGWG